MRKPTYLSTKFRLVLAGDELEIKYFEKPIYYGYSADPKVPIYHETEEDSGKLHYHILIFNLPFVDNLYDVVNEEWGLGFIWIEKVPDKNIGQYITKYMTKTDDEKLRGQMSYLRSQGLLEPTVILDEKFIRKIFHSMPYEAQIFANAYESEHHGMTEIKKFSLGKFPKIKTYILANIPKPARFKIKL